MIVKLPTWKVYLYTLAQRVRLYKWLNSGWVQLNLSGKEIDLLKRMFKTYVPKGVMRKAKAWRYEYLVRSVLTDNIEVATKDELEIAFKLSWIKHLHLEDLIMELKQIKEFGKEVGMKPLAMGKMDEETLIVEILKKVDPSNEYSTEFIAWYESLEDEYFDKAETVDVNPSAGEAEEATNGDFDELIQVINETTKVADLKEICKDDDFGYLFEGIQLGKYRAATTLKPVMLEAIENYGKDAGADETAGGAIEVDDETKEMLVEAINEIEDEDGLIALIGDEDIEALFAEHLEIGDEIDVENIKAQMLTALGVVEEEEVVEEKPMSIKERLAAAKAGKTEAATTSAASAAPSGDDWVIEGFDPNAFDLEAVYELTEALPIPKLRKWAKQLEITVPAGSKKDTILEMVGEQLTAMAEGGAGAVDSTEESETEVNQSMVNDAIAAGDKDALLEMCDAFGIKLSILQKKSIKIMGEKLLEVVPEDAPANRDAGKGGKKGLLSKLKAKDTSSAPTAETQSIYQSIEQMVLNGDAEAAIVKAVTPAYKEKGKTLLYIKKVVKQMVEIVKGDNDL